MAYGVNKTQSEIDEQLNRCVQIQETGEEPFPGMTYSQGVEYALRWVTGDSSEEPLPEQTDVE